MVTREITFQKEGHKRTDEDGNVYASITGEIGTYHEQFDENYWAAQKAIELGTTASLIKQNWKEIREKACDKGNVEHELLEDSINYANGKQKFKFDKTKISSYNGVRYILPNQFTAKPIDIVKLAESPLGKKYPLILEMLVKFIEKGYQIYAEVTIYYYEALIAGCTDCIAVKGREFVIIDWKTNKDELKFTAGYFKKINNVKTDIWVPQPHKRMSPPISNLPDCKGSIYTMQLSMYARLFELWGYVCRGLILFHIRDNNAPKPYKIRYLREHCDKILNARIDRLKSDRNRTNRTKGTPNFGIM